LQEFPVAKQLIPVKFGPSLNEPTLRPGETPPDTLDGIDSVDRRRLLVVRVEVRPMMRSGRFREHADHNSKEARDLRHHMMIARTQPLALLPSSPHRAYARRRRGRAPPQRASTLYMRRRMIHGSSLPHGGPTCTIDLCPHSWSTAKRAASVHILLYSFALVERRAGTAGAWGRRRAEGGQSRDRYDISSDDHGCRRITGAGSSGRRA
jgi:hypothetical protein